MISRETIRMHRTSITTLNSFSSRPTRRLKFITPPRRIDLLVVRSLINECPDRGSYRERRATPMTHFTIDNDNNITAHATAAEAKALTGTERFSNEAALAKLAANWTAARLVEIHNTLTGVTPVKKFKDRNTAATRIWTAIQSLGQPAATKEAQDSPEPQPEPAAEPEPIPEPPTTVAPEAQQTPDAATQEEGHAREESARSQGSRRCEGCPRW
jgi:hypothetical protein